MKAQRLKYTQNRPDIALNRETVLANWMEAVTTFEQYYNDLGYYMATDRQSGHVGQCPTGGLVTMLTCMQDELENLVLDLDKMDQAILHKIADHTVALNRLNHQAQILLHVASISAS